MSNNYKVLEQEWAQQLLFRQAISLNEALLIQYIIDNWCPSQHGMCVMPRGKMASWLALSRVSISAMLKHLLAIKVLESSTTRTQIIGYRLSHRYVKLGREGMSPVLVNELTTPISNLYSKDHLSNKKQAEISGSRSNPKIRGINPIPCKDDPMPLHPELIVPEKKQAAQPIHLELAKKLHDALSTHPINPPKRNAWKKWAHEFYLLEHKDGIAIERMEATIEWLCSPIQIEKTKCRSGRRFREMFEDLETYAQGDKSRSPSADAVQLSSLELSYLKTLDNFNQPISTETLKEAGTMVKQHLHRLAAVVEANPQLFKRPADREYNIPRISKLRHPQIWYAIMESMCHRLKHWVEWNGDLRPPARNILKSNSIELTAHFRSIDLSWSEIHNLFKEQLSAR